MCSKGICGQVVINTLDRYSQSTLNDTWSILDRRSIDTLVDTQSTLHRPLCWQAVERQLIFDQCMSRLTLRRLSTDCWTSVDWVLTEYRLRCWSSVSIDGIDRHSTAMPIVIKSCLHCCKTGQSWKYERIGNTNCRRLLSTFFECFKITNVH